jgi:hypothetical protein
MGDTFKWKIMNWKNRERYVSKMRCDMVNIDR